MSRQASEKHKATRKKSEQQITSSSGRSPSLSHEPSETPAPFSAPFFCAAAAAAAAMTPASPPPASSPAPMSSCSCPSNSVLTAAPPSSVASSLDTEMLPPPALASAVVGVVSSSPFCRLGRANAASGGTVSRFQRRRVALVSNEISSIQTKHTDCLAANTLGVDSARRREMLVVTRQETVASTHGYTKACCYVLDV